MGEGFGSGGLWAGMGLGVLTLLTALVAWPKNRAQARKLNADADDSIAARLTREIKRLDDEIKELRNEVTAVKTDAADEKRAIEVENRRLKRLVHILASELHRIDPENPKLAGVATALNNSFTIEPNVPSDMAGTLGKISSTRRRRK